MSCSCPPVISSARIGAAPACGGDGSAAHPQIPIASNRPVINLIARITNSVQLCRFVSTRVILPPAMLARIHSFVLVGIDPLLCEVEVDVSKQGLEHSTVVGLAQAAVKESMERVKRAIINSGYPYPRNRLLVNLAPADV